MGRLKKATAAEDGGNTAAKACKPPKKLEKIPPQPGADLKKPTNTNRLNSQNAINSNRMSTNALPKVQGEPMSISASQLVMSNERQSPQMSNNSPNTHSAISVAPK